MAGHDHIRSDRPRGTIKQESLMTYYPGTPPMVPTSELIKFVVARPIVLNGRPGVILNLTPGPSLGRRRIHFGHATTV